MSLRDLHKAIVLIRIRSNEWDCSKVLNTYLGTYLPLWAYCIRTRLATLYHELQLEGT